MTTKPTVFVHTSCHEIMSGKVAAYSLKRMSSNTDKFDVKLIELENYPHLIKYHGHRCIRNNRDAAWYKDVPQSFLPLRFIVPQLMGYQGKAIVIDPDIFAVSDVYELLERDMKDKAILARPIYAKDKIIGHNSSVMLLDCSKLKHWQWEQQIDEVFQLKRDLQDWIFLRTEPRDSMGELEEEWNHYDTLNEKTKLLHNTNQITQPWKTGLPYHPSRLNNNVQGFASLKLQLISGYNQLKKSRSHRESLKSIQQLFWSSKAEQLYRKHPDIKQETLFFGYLKEALLAGFIDEDFLREQIKKRHIRQDIFNVLDGLGSLGKIEKKCSLNEL
ncbi:hypothetical protein [Crocosphaera sp. XPORK-15E]|uniref:hypothetical protein n=1 Tax=Crocosphaera sp. XPORK-15E TaxID=3110247 RepID=UPI002B1F2EA7|nr:hypothetical protein [Crocosphaera sp. XPORK-15E]MEA5534777.1 hypothetical protein [Crocosphaera sp. XPORK-15E]